MNRRTYYRGPDAVVTDRLFVWHTAPTKSFIVQDLQNVGLALFATAFWRMRPRRWELRATYQGHEVILYASCDTRVFNQVARALRRAVEDTRRPAAGYGLAS